MAITASQFFDDWTSALEPYQGDYETTASQVDRLAAFITENIPGEPSQNQGAVDTAIRLMQERLPRRGFRDMAGQGSMIDEILNVGDVFREGSNYYYLTAIVGVE